MTPDDLALAYELHVSAGWSWKRIAQELGRVDPAELYDRVRHARRHGLYDRRVRVTDAQILAAQTMRAHSRLSWAAIGRYLGLSVRSIQCAVWRRG